MIWYVKVLSVMTFTERSQIISLADPSLALPHLSQICLRPAEDGPGVVRRCATGKLRQNERDRGAIKRSIERFTLELGDIEMHGHAALPEFALGSQLYKFEAPGAGMPGTYKLSALNRYVPFGFKLLDRNFKLPRDDR